jgi:DNA-directed RNA polymerase specialized sigma subunit
MVAISNYQQRLIEDCGDLAHRVVRRMRGQYRGMSFIDGQSIANLALLHAAMKFDPCRGNRFATYATVVIENTLRREIGQEIQFRMLHRQNGELTTHYRITSEHGPAERASMKV